MGRRLTAGSSITHEQVTCDVGSGSSVPVLTTQAVYHGRAFCCDRNSLRGLLVAPLEG